MENPKYWKKAEHVINMVWADHLRLQEGPLDELLIGGSLPFKIAQALRKEGLLREEKDEKANNTEV